jgi:ribonuclease HII
MNSEISLRYEQDLWQSGALRVAGVDEAGRGPLAGPVVAAAVIFPVRCVLAGVDDSKKLSPGRREELYAEIQTRALGIGVGIVDNEEIDRINILQATFKAMRVALDSLAVPPDHVLVDGNRFAAGALPFTTIVHGDALCQAIAAASIIAKVTRDRIMCEQDALYPAYGFARHKGYGTAEHRAAIAQHGLCIIHRRSFCTNFSGGHDERTGKLR